MFTESVSILHEHAPHKPARAPDALSSSPERAESAERVRHRHRERDAAERRVRRGQSRRSLRAARLHPAAAHRPPDRVLGTLRYLQRERQQLFSLVIFGCIANEGYVNRPDEVEQFCVFNRNQNACNYAVSMGSLAFLSCMAFLALDAYFPQISSVKERKRAVLADVGTSAFWSFVWFVGFCFLANQWQVAKPEDNPLRSGGDAARAAITFSFFSIFTWGALTLVSLERLKRVCFEEEYEELFTQQPTHTHE
ncbi:synaptogyrin-1-like isoform X3 [Onychostoma macrolepis]|uniref:synaptogyrin-1-like isoform X3 n=1 Tax=Onychostoma macrolepis TaxID=369639 RepID=UPI00272AC36E|nr:synaptogyrin-1-like isoform X3 [Onychostoma macrolepis]